MLKVGAVALVAPALLTHTKKSFAAAKKLGPASPTFYRFTLGDFEITTINDGAIQLDGPHPIFGGNVSAEDVQKLMAENFLPTKRMEIAFTPTLVNTGKEIVLFDAGNGAVRRGKGAGLLIERLAAAGFSAEQVDIVAITHCHPDHIGGLMENGKPAFPNARYVISSAEYDFWSPKEKAEGNLARVGKLVQSNVVPLAEKMTFIKPDQDVVTGITAVDSFGHTPGHLAFNIESNGKQFLLWADTTNHFVASLQRPDWHVRFDMDKEKATQSRKRILDMVAADKIPATGYHMPIHAIGYVEKKDSGYRYIPVTYQLSL